MIAIVKLTENYAETDIDDEIIIMRLDNGELLTLCGTAATTWRLIDGTRDYEALVRTLDAEFAADGQEIASGVGQLLRQLKESGLVADG